jgi:hypothetical protein
VVSVVEGVRGAPTTVATRKRGKAPQFISLQTIKLTDTSVPSSEYKIVLFLETISA